jgi:hypothetical protein
VDFNRLVRSTVRALLPCKFTGYGCRLEDAKVRVIVDEMLNPIQSCSYRDDWALKINSMFSNPVQ